MADHVGALLWEMRTATGLTLGRLAERAGISKASLSRWEAGLHQPHVTELEAVLNVLGASSAQRSLALSRITAPRALRQLRQPSSAENLGAPLSAGDLLRAMRLRGGWTQEEVAARLGVTRATLTRWELGERLPATEQMQSLCYALEAREQEIIALTSGQFREASASVEGTDWEEKEAELLRRFEAVNTGRVGGLADLHYIQLDREMWQWALREPTARLLLAQLRVFHGHYHRMSERWERSHTLSQQTHQALQSALQPEPERNRLVSPRLAILQAVVAVHGGVRPAPERGLRMLLPWVDRSHVPAVYQAWILSDIAKYTAMVGNHEDAFVYAERACRLVAQETESGELFLRRADYAQLLLQGGRPEEALRILPEPLSHGGHMETVDALLIQVEALACVGQLSEAQDWLERANAIIEAHSLEPQRRKALALARRL